MKRHHLLTLAAIAMLGGYYLWSFYVDSRYRALCNVDYWHATPAQISACRDVKTELDNQK